MSSLQRPRGLAPAVCGVEQEVALSGLDSFKGFINDLGICSKIYRPPLVSIG